MCRANDDYIFLFGFQNKSAAQFLFDKIMIAVCGSSGNELTYETSQKKLCSDNHSHDGKKE
jgi:hypothetical protein